MSNTLGHIGATEQSNMDDLGLLTGLNEIFLALQNAAAQQGYILVSQQKVSFFLEQLGPPREPSGLTKYFVRVVPEPSKEQKIAETLAAIAQQNENKVREQLNEAQRQQKIARESLEAANRDAKKIIDDANYQAEKVKSEAKNTADALIKEAEEKKRITLETIEKDAQRAEEKAKTNLAAIEKDAERAQDKHDQKKQQLETEIAELNTRKEELLKDPDLKSVFLIKREDEKYEKIACARFMIDDIEASIIYIANRSFPSDIKCVAALVKFLCSFNDRFLSALIEIEDLYGIGDVRGIAAYATIRLRKTDPHILKFDYDSGGSTIDIALAIRHLLVSIHAEEETAAQQRKSFEGSFEKIMKSKTEISRTELFNACRKFYKDCVS